MRNHRRLALVSLVGLLAAACGSASGGATGTAGTHNAAGLSGKSIAVNALDSISEVTVEAAIDAAGGDSAKVKFVEMPFPQMVAAVQRGLVSGAMLGEPYLTQAKEAGLVDLFPVMSKVIPGTPQLVYIASKAYATSHPAIVNAFAASITAANGDLGRDPSLIRSVGAKSTTVGASVLAKIILPAFIPAALTASSLATLEQLMIRYKVLKAPLQASSYLYTAAG
jgi:NitT/TauT family transport system substrate-binding protein